MFMLFRAFSELRRARRQKIEIREARKAQCTCRQEVVEAVQNLTDPHGFVMLAPASSSESADSVLLPALGGGRHTDDKKRPPLPVGGQMPILLPNEIVLQRFNGRRAVDKISSWRCQREMQKCRRCKSGSSPVLAVPENDHTELSEGAMVGKVFVTSERIIFVPRSVGVAGFSVDIASVTEAKVVESTLGRWFFVAYYDGQRMVAIGSNQRSRAFAFLRLIMNVRFEHMVRRCLPPCYVPPDCPADQAWQAADDKLPTYQESEQALHRYLVLKGWLAEDEPLERTGRVSQLIALASLPTVASSRLPHAIVQQVTGALPPAPTGRRGSAPTPASPAIAPSDSRRNSAHSASEALRITYPPSTSVPWF